MISFETEYGSKGIYCYGIMLLEMLTRKKPTDDMFLGELNLRQWVKVLIPYKIMKVIDRNLLMTKQGKDAITAQVDALAFMELRLECSRELLEERIGIRDIIIKLNKIKSQIL